MKAPAIKMNCVEGTKIRGAENRWFWCRDESKETKEKKG
jgi:hypothetical protein